MNKYLKIRINFNRENVIEDVNMSILCDVLMQCLPIEIKEQLKEANEADYIKIIQKLINN